MEKELYRPEVDFSIFCHPLSRTYRTSGCGVISKTLGFWGTFLYPQNPDEAGTGLEDFEGTF